jgi:exopolysaccharide biosynthesis polyprenyl glycosylphosphotransferase
MGPLDSVRAMDSSAARAPREREYPEHPRLVPPSPPTTLAPPATPAPPLVVGAVVLPPEAPPRDMRRKRPPALSLLLRMETARRLARVISLLAVDFGAVALAILTALIIKALVLSQPALSPAWHETKHIIAFAYLVTVLLFARSGLYAERAQRPGLTRIVGSLFQVTVVAVIFAVVQGEHFSSFYIFYGSLGFALLYVSCARFVYEQVTGGILRAAGYHRRTLLVGSGQHIADVGRALGGGALEIVGYISRAATPPNGLPALGTLAELDHVLAANRVDEVIIADADFPQLEVIDLVDRCHRRGVSVRVAPSTMEILIHRAEFVPGASIPLFELKPPVFEGVDYLLKRTFDLVGAVVLLLLLSPILLTIMIAIRVSSRGGAVYRQPRPGIGGRPFDCLKFRTMLSGADERQAELEDLNEANGALFKIRDDPRMTRIGRVLRRFSLDELPQLVNVLRGEMSLVGPRPLPQRDYDRLEEWHRKRYLVMPGITGLWQISGRSDLDFDDLVRLDFLYLERWSIALDFAILVKTIPAVLSRRGAF